MKFLVFVLISMSASAAGPSCEKLKGYLNTYEQQLMAANIKDATQDKPNLPFCKTMDGKALVLKDKDDKAIEDDKFINDKIDEYECKDLASIELRIRSIENELAMLKGIEQVKKEILEGQKKVATQKKAEVAAQEFKDNLDIARHLELLVKAPKKKGADKTFLQQLVERDPTQWDTIEEFKALKERYCDNKTNKDVTDQCSETFDPSKDVLVQLQKFVETGKNTEKKFDQKKSKDLEEALKIQKADGSVYSYSQMYLAIKDNLPVKDGAITKDMVQAIKDLPEFKNGTGFDFITNMTSSKDALKNQAIGAQYKNYLIDLGDRHDFEMTAKLSLVLKNFSYSLKTGNTPNCQKAVTELKNIPDCFDGLLATVGLSSPAKARLTDLKKEFEGAVAHKNVLADHIETCTPDVNLNFPKGKKKVKDANGKEEDIEKDCREFLSYDTVQLQKEHQALDALKEKILKQNELLAKVRNYAIEQYQVRKCANVDPSVVNNCYEANISSEGVALTSDTLDIMIFQNKKTKDTDLTLICENKEAKFTHKSEICSISDEVDDSYNRVDKDQYRHETTTGDNYQQNQTRNALFDVLGSLTGYAANQMYTPYLNPNQNFAPNYPTSNTPAYTYSQYNSIMGSQLGYGFYPATTYEGAVFPTKATYFDPKYTTYK